MGAITGIFDFYIYGTGDEQYEADDESELDPRRRVAILRSANSTIVPDLKLDPETVLLRIVPGKDEDTTKISPKPTSKRPTVNSSAMISHPSISILILTRVIIYFFQSFTFV